MHSAIAIAMDILLWTIVDFENYIFLDCFASCFLTFKFALFKFSEDAVYHFSTYKQMNTDDRLIP